MTTVGRALHRKTIAIKIIIKIIIKINDYSIACLPALYRLGIRYGDGAIKNWCNYFCVHFYFNFSFFCCKGANGANGMNNIFNS